METQETTGLAMPVKELLTIRSALVSAGILAEIVKRGVIAGGRDARYYARLEAKIADGLALLERIGAGETAKVELARVERLGAGVTRLHSALGVVDLRGEAVQGTTITDEAARAAVVKQWVDRELRKLRTDARGSRG